MTDTYYVYRPMLDLIGRSEGTDKRRGYDETLGYGAFTGGDVNLVGMTLDQVDALQTKMLKHPKNKLRSSALGRFQIVRTTLREIRTQLGLDGKSLFDREMQDRMACYLLGQRGIDKWLAGRLKTNTLLTNLAKEWASLPQPNGKGYYDGQSASVPVTAVLAALNEVRRRHKAGQPKETIEVPVPVEKPVVPETVDQAVEKKTSIWQWLIGVIGSGGIGLGWLGGLDWQAIVAAGGVLVALLLVLVLLRRQVVGAVREIRAELER